MLEDACFLQVSCSIRAHLCEELEDVLFIQDMSCFCMDLTASSEQSRVARPVASLVWRRSATDGWIGNAGNVVDPFLFISYAFERRADPYERLCLFPRERETFGAGFGGR